MDCLEGECLCPLSDKDLAKAVPGDVFDDVIALARESFEVSRRPYSRDEPPSQGDPYFLQVMVDAETAKRESAQRAVLQDAPAARVHFQLDTARSQLDSTSDFVLAFGAGFSASACLCLLITLISF
jgi:hypothetical protein